MVPVRKPDGTVRLCIDNRKINGIDPFQILLIEDLLDSLSEAKYISKLDMNKGFYQIPVAEKDQDKTAFVLPGGSIVLPECHLGCGMHWQHSNTV